MRIIHILLLCLIISGSFASRSKRFDDVVSDGHDSIHDEPDDEGPGHGNPDRNHYDYNNPNSYLDSNGYAISSRSPHTGLLIMDIIMNKHVYSIQSGCLAENTTMYINSLVSVAIVAAQEIQSLVTSNKTNTTTLQIMTNLNVINNVATEINQMFETSSGSKYTIFTNHFTFWIYLIIFYLYF